MKLNLSRKRLFSAFAVLIAGLVIPASAQEEEDVITTDTAPNNKVVATIDVGAGPHVIVLSPTSNLAYVGNYSGNSISVIDTSTNTLSGTFISAGPSPDGIAITPDGTQLYVPNDIANGTVSILNASTGALEKTITVGTNPRYVSISPDGKLAYVANEESGTISVIDTQTEAVTTSITIGKHAASATFTADSKEAYACEDGSGFVYVIDTQTSAIAHTISTVGDPLYCVLNPKSGDLYCTNFLEATISVIKGAKVTKKFRPGEIPSVPAVTPNGKYLYVPQYYTSGTNYGDTVIVVSTKTYKKVGTPITVGTGPAWVAITKNGGFAYVSNFAANTVSVIKITPAQ
ncbi:MAG: YncE family protein [Verrucomicrobia bacterium]|nr:YncE family protein [Verrucomicrobiota bacterium]MBV8279670.1 YncE family protein [Verrucomicrobiota bacterium]